MGEKRGKRFILELGKVMGFEESNVKKKENSLSHRAFGGGKKIGIEEFKRIFFMMFQKKAIAPDLKMSESFQLELGKYEEDMMRLKLGITGAEIINRGKLENIWQKYSQEMGGDRVLLRSRVRELMMNLNEELQVAYSEKILEDILQGREGILFKDFVSLFFFSTGKHYNPSIPIAHLFWFDIPLKTHNIHSEQTWLTRRARSTLVTRWWT